MSACVGLGCNARATAAAVVARVREACARAGLNIQSLHTSDTLDHPALEAAAAQLGVPLMRHDAAALQRAATGVVSHSARVAARFGVGSLAEAAALAGAGEGARLVVPKFSAEGVSCALAAR